MTEAPKRVRRAVGAEAAPIQAQSAPTLHQKPVAPPERGTPPNSPPHVWAPPQRRKRSKLWNPTDQKRDATHPTQITDALLKNLIGIDGDAVNTDVERGRAHAQFLRSSCAYFAAEVLQGPPQPPFDGKFFVGEHHLAWDALAVNEKRLCVLAPRGHGKCVLRGSLVAAADGRRVPVQEWKGGDLVSFDPGSGNLVTAWAPASRPNGVKQTIRFTTRTGRTDTVTLNHRLRLWNAWVYANKLQPGMRIAVPRHLPVEGAKPLPKGDAWMLGALIGDGGLSTTSTATFTNTDVGILGAFILFALARGWTCKPTADGAITFGLGNEWKRDGGPREWTRGYGIQGKGSYEKVVPDAIFTAPNTDVCAFLAGLIDTDGHVSPHGGGCVEFYSVSEALLRGVQHLLTRLDVVAVLAPKMGTYKGEPHASWRLTIRGLSIPTLFEHLGPHLASGKKAAFETLAAEPYGGGGARVDLLPMEASSLLQHSEDWFRKHNLPRISTQYGGITRSKALTCAEAEGNTALKQLAEGPVLWDEVVSVEMAGEQETWSMHVPHLENYVSNDVVTHNTFFFDFAFPIWKACFQPNGKGYIFSATAPQAARILGDIKEEIESNPKLQWLLPKKKSGAWSSTSITLSNGHKIYARGFGTKVRGAHPDWIVVDDGLNDEDVYSEVTRAKNIDYFYTAISNMIVPGGQIIVVGTPFHAADLYADLAKNKKYSFQKFPAIKLVPANDNEEPSDPPIPEAQVTGSTGNLYLVSRVTEDAWECTCEGFKHRKACKHLDTGKAKVRAKEEAWRIVERARLKHRRFDEVILWPQLFSKQDLADKKQEIGSVRFTREFLCEPISDEMSLFPEKLFRGQDVEVYGAALGLPAKFWNEQGITRRYIGVDFALSSTTSADYTAVFVLGLDAVGNRWIIDIQQHRGLEYQEQLSLIHALGRKYKPEMIYLEANQMQRIFGDELIRTSDLPIGRFYTTGVGNQKKSRKKVPGANTVSQNKNSLEGGVPSLRVLLENRKFRIPRGDEYSVEMTDRWIAEMKAFTWTDGKLQGVGSHDDMVMALWIADRAIKDTGFSFQDDEDDGADPATLDALLREQQGIADDGTILDDVDTDPDVLVPSGKLDVHGKPLLEKVDPVLLVVQKFGTNVDSPGHDKKKKSPPTRVNAASLFPDEGGSDDDDSDDDGNVPQDLTARAAKAAWSNLPGLRR